jgi:hypothetical protein
VQKVGRIALIVAGVIGTLAAVALLAVNLYVQSQTTQARIQEELSERLGTTLRVQRISVTPWWGLKLTGITMPQEDGTGEFLHAQTFRLRVAIASLFSERLVIKEVSLIKPSVIWAQNADGKWRLPTTRSVDGEDTASRSPDDGALARPAAPPPQIVERNAATTSAAEVTESDDGGGRFTPEVRRVKLVDGSFRFLDVKRKPVATFEGVRFQSDFRSANELRGNASIVKTSLRDRFFLERLHSPVRYDSDELEFADIRAQAAGGEITGNFRMSPATPESPFSVLVRFQGLEADRLIADAHGPAGILHGRLEGQLEAKGQTSDPNALSGVGEIHLRDGEVRRYSLLVALGQLLQLEDLQQLKFEEAHVRYHIQPGVVTVDELLLSSPSMRLSAAGTIGFDGRLQLDSRLAISDAVRRQLFRPIRNNFQATEQEGFAAVDFRVTGTVERPRSDLMDKLVGRELKDIGSVINSFLGGGKSNRDKQKRETAADAAPAGAADHPAAEPAPEAPAEAPFPSEPAPSP